jgi:hypothetical protein
MARKALCHVLNSHIFVLGYHSGLISALASQNAENRCKIATRYPQLHGKQLKAVIKSECGGDFGTALQFLSVPTHEMECDMIQEACQGLGTNELVLYPIICGRTNEEINILKKKFYDVTGKDLGRVLDAELGGDLEKLIFNCLQGSEEEFDPAFHNDSLVKQDVETIYKAGQGSFGTNESGFFKVLVARPSEHLKTVNLAYAEKYGYTLFKALETEIGGQTGDAALFMLGMKLRPYETIAKLIKKACAGLGTNELLLTCCIVRYQPHLKHVMEAYTELYSESLQEDVRKELGGDFEKLLLQVCAAAVEN